MYSWASLGPRKTDLFSIRQLSSNAGICFTVNGACRFFVASVFLGSERISLGGRFAAVLCCCSADTAEGFLSIMTRNRTNQPRRAYLCFKYLMLLANRESTLGDELRNRLSSPSDDVRRLFVTTLQIDMAFFAARAYCIGGDD